MADAFQEVDYIQLWNLEKHLDLASWRNFLESNSLFPVQLSLVYISLIFGGQELMKNRKPFVLRNVLASWNFFLAIFSILGFLRTLPELSYILRREGFHDSVCSGKHHNQATAFWGLMFALSKVVELMDTGFIVLKKKPLRFLGWGHHTIVLLTSFWAYPAQSSSWRWFITMNFFVHSVLYTYFCLKTLNVRVPRVVSVFVTFVQTFQMFVGLAVSVYSLYVSSTGGDCFVPTWLMCTSTFCYILLLHMFGSLFFNMYIRRKPVQLKLD